MKKFCIRDWLLAAEAFPSFSSKKELGVLLFSLDVMPVYSRLTAPSPYISPGFTESLPALISTPYWTMAPWEFSILLKKHNTKTRLARNCSASVPNISKLRGNGDDITIKFLKVDSTALRNVESCQLVKLNTMLLITLNKTVSCTVPFHHCKDSDWSECCGAQWFQSLCASAIPGSSVESIHQTRNSHWRMEYQLGR